LGKRRGGNYAYGKCKSTRIVREYKYFMAATQAAKEMRRYLKMDEVEAGNEKIEDIEEMVVNDIEGPGDDEDSSAKAIETRKDKEDRMKNMLVQATQAHELLADSFWKAHLRVEGKILLPRDHDGSDFVED